jgi:hypothetical protein
MMSPNEILTNCDPGIGGFLIIALFLAIGCICAVFKD